MPASRPDTPPPTPPRPVPSPSPGPAQETPRRVRPWIRRKTDQDYELLGMQSADRKNFEAVRRQKRNELIRLYGYGPKINTFDFKAALVRKELRADHKRLRMFKNLDEQISYSKMILEDNYGLNFYV